MFRGSGHGRHEHVGDGAAAHLGGGALPSSKVRSDLPISTHTFGYPALGSLHASLKPAPSALKKQRGSGRPILHGVGGTLTVLSQRPSLIEYALARRAPRDAGKQCTARLVPENKPAQFRLRLPEMWSLDETWEVGLFQLLLPHTWCNELAGQVGLRLHYQQNPDVRVFLRAGTHVTVQDVVEGWLQVMEANAPNQDNFRGLPLVLNERGFYKWTFLNAEFSVYLLAWLACVLGYLDGALLLPLRRAPSHGGDHPTR